MTQNSGSRSMLIRILTRLFRDVPYSWTKQHKWFTGVRTDISDADADITYMRRFYILSTPFGAIYIHQFFRSDSDRGFHDHPKNFAVLILSGGYWEETPIWSHKRRTDDPKAPGQEYIEPDDNFTNGMDFEKLKETVEGMSGRVKIHWNDKKPNSIYRYYGPGSFRRFPALWMHRVVLSDPSTRLPCDPWKNGDPLPVQAVTLAFVGPRRREWGFYHPILRWIHWKRYREVWGASNLDQPTS